ncbi:hypothetical protein Hanom_Chr13g01185501 [Helianthus anomalus]
MYTFSPKTKMIISMACFISIFLYHHFFLFPFQLFESPYVLINSRFALPPTHRLRQPIKYRSSYGGTRQSLKFNSQIQHGRLPNRRYGCTIITVTITIIIRVVKAW